MAAVTKKNRSGFTLIEVMIAAVVVIVGVLGAMMYRYHTALDARKADLQLGATRVGLLLLEEWKGMSGADYDPTRTETYLTVSGSGPDYTATLEGDVSNVANGGTGAIYLVSMPQPPVNITIDDIVMKELKVTVYWSNRGTPTAASHTGGVTLKDWTD